MKGIVLALAMFLSGFVAVAQTETYRVVNRKSLAEDVLKAAVLKGLHGDGLTPFDEHGRPAQVTDGDGLFEMIAEFAIENISSGDLAEAVSIQPYRVSIGEGRILILGEQGDTLYDNNVVRAGGGQFVLADGRVLEVLDIGDDLLSLRLPDGRTLRMRRE